MKGRRKLLPTLSENDIEEQEEEHAIPEHPPLSATELSEMTIPGIDLELCPTEEEEHESELLAQALMREFLHRRGYTKAYEEFANAVPKLPEEPTLRTDLASRLFLTEDFKGEKQTKPNPPSVLEVLIRNQLRYKPGKRAAISTPPGHTCSSRQTKKKHEQLDISSDGNQAMVGGKFILSGNKMVGENGEEAFQAFAIADIDDLDLENETRLGSGAGGAVYKVLHKPTCNYIALKKIRTDQNESGAQAYKELQALYAQANQISAPLYRNIIGFHGAFYNEGMVFLALECMSGSLQDIIQKNKSTTEGCPENVIQAIAYQALNGLHYLHKERHMIHRDIKPANILYNNRGEIKISDFGVASEELMKTIAQAKTFVGTTSYMSPERLKAEPYDNKVDIFSFGLVLVVLATNEHPARGNFWEVLNKVQQQVSLPETFSLECRAFVDSCLQLLPQNRASTHDLQEHQWMVDMTDGKAQHIFSEYLTTLTQQLEAGTGDNTNIQSSAHGGIADEDSQLVLSRLDSLI